MNSNVLNFVSKFSCYENEKNFFIDLENFLVSEFLIRPILVYSIKNNSENICLSKSRSVLGNTDRLKLYSTKLLDELLIKRSDVKEIPCLEVKVDSCYYYYLNLGEKGNQFYFSLFSTPAKIEIEPLRIISQYSCSQLEVVKRIQNLKKEQELIHIDIFYCLFLEFIPYLKSNDFEP